MKSKNLLLILLIVLIGIIIYTIFRKEKVKTVYTFVNGLPDTTIIRDIVSISKSYKVTITKFDTIRIDSIGKIDYNSITASWERFNLKADSNIGCLGKVRLHASNYEFDSINIYYPKTTIKQVDTIKISEIVNKKFYENEWFWVSAGLIVYSVIKEL